MAKLPRNQRFCQEEPESLEVVENVGERDRNRSYNLLILNH
jgi:hypothetical protein